MVVLLGEISGENTWHGVKSWILAESSLRFSVKIYKPYLGKPENLKVYRGFQCPE